VTGSQKFPLKKVQFPIQVTRISWTEHPRHESSEKGVPFRAVWVSSIESRIKNLTALRGGELPQIVERGDFSRKKNVSFMEVHWSDRRDHGGRNVLEVPKEG
jgi:hypothetical protein